MTYKGDTPPKKRARVETWFTIRDELGSRFAKGRHLVLAGPDAGDISVALGLGVPVSGMLAVDRSKPAVTAARFRFPEADVQHCEVIDVLGKGLFDSVFLDFCCPVMEAELDTAALAVSTSIRSGGVFACAFLAGREQDTAGGLRSRVLAVREKIEKSVSYFPPERRKEWLPLIPYLARATVIDQELMARTRSAGWLPVPVAQFFYKSKEDGDYKGMPMCIYVARVLWHSRRSLHRETKKALETLPRLEFFNCTNRELGVYAMWLIEQGLNPALLLNVAETSVRAWKAHATRGTYG